MIDITEIDWKAPFTKIIEGDITKIAKQKVFFLQDGIEYGPQGKACNSKQVKAYYATKAADAQKIVNDAVEAAKIAQENVDAMFKQAK